jgi:hypothetical protein
MRKVGANSAKERGESASMVSAAEYGPTKVSRTKGKVEGLLVIFGRRPLDAKQGWPVHLVPER